MSREIVEDVLGRQAVRELWTANYEKALPVALLNFELPAVLPAVFYMFRWGSRRGKGKFLETYGTDVTVGSRIRRAATVGHIAARLSQTDAIAGFDEDVGQAILADVLLAFCFENVRRDLGRDKQVQRVFPTHYMASWIDLPDKVANLRYVPEMLVALLADQQESAHVARTPDGDRTWFPVGAPFESNLLLQPFSAGMKVDGLPTSRKSDVFDENARVSIDELITIRAAQLLGEPPDKLRGREGDKISNQKPLAQRAARWFAEDLRCFVRSYGTTIPRTSLLPMLESSIAVGLTTVLGSTVELLLEWENSGRLADPSNQAPTPFFVDTSSSLERDLRLAAERSFDDYMRKLDRLPPILMELRLLDYFARNDPKVKRRAISASPDAREWVTFLGEILHSPDEDTEMIHRDIERKSSELADRLRDESPDVVATLENDRVIPNPVVRLATALSNLIGYSALWQNLYKFLDSAALCDRPNGLLKKRRITRQTAEQGRRQRDARSVVLTDSVLDYLVHTMLAPKKVKQAPNIRARSLPDFLKHLRDRYGLYVDQSPPGMTVSAELLHANRRILERRLRDLGLLSGVNDAETMKKLTPRFEVAPLA